LMSLVLLAMLSSYDKIREMFLGLR
jgi:hypothetical protein